MQVGLLSKWELPGMWGPPSSLLRLCWMGGCVNSSCKSPGIYETVIKMLNCIPRYESTNGTSWGVWFNEQITDASMHYCTIAKMHQRTNELLQEIISQILKIKYHNTECDDWGPFKLAKSIKNIKYLSKIIIFKIKNLNWGICALVHLSIWTLAY